MAERKVLEVAFPALNNSGVPAVIMGIVRELHNNLDFDVLVFRKDVGYHEKEFLSYGGIIHHIDSDKTGNKGKDVIEKIVRPWRLYSGTRKILREGHYDAIHCHNGFDSCWCLMAAKKEGVSIRAVHSHASVNPYEKRGFGIRVYEKYCQKKIRENGNRFIACSQKAAIRLFGNNVSKLYIIYNAIDNSKFNPALFNNKLINKNAPTITYVGRFSIEKNTVFVIDVFQKVHAKIANAKLKLVGFGNLKEEIENRIEEYNLRDSVSFLPQDYDIPELLSHSDVFILPSQAEGFGIALLEAQSMGVLSFASETVPKEADVGLCDYLSLSNGADAWAEAIISELNQHGEERTYPTPEILKKYSWDNIAKQYLSVLTEID